MFKYIIILISSLGISYSQCNDLVEYECVESSDCEWIENVEYGWCGSYDNNSTECNNQEQCSYSTCAQACNWGGSAECESYPGCSYSYLTYSCSGTTYVPCCSGGSFQENNSYCQEMPSCSDMNQLQCASSGECEWVEDTQIENCYGIAWNEQDCEEVEGCTWWTSSYYGTANCAGSYEANNSYCEDGGMLECSEINESECVNSDSCEWFESIQYYSCSQFNSSDQCNSYSEYGCYTSWNSTTWEDDCNGPSFQIDNSYCEEIEILDCVDMTELECSNDDSCEWEEDIEWGSCEDLTPIWNVAYYCDDLSTNSDNCYTYTCYGGSYGSWGTCCGGDPYVIDNNSYCADISFIPGDSNGDGSLNINDIVLIVDLILSATYDVYSDMNQDGLLNIIDVVELVNLILEI